MHEPNTHNHHYLAKIRLHWPVPMVGRTAKKVYRTMCRIVGNAPVWLHRFVCQHCATIQMDPVCILVHFSSEIYHDSRFGIWLAISLTAVILWLGQIDGDQLDGPPAD